MYIQAATPEQYISKLEEPRKTQIRKIHEFIKKTVPSLKAYIESGMIGYGSYHYKYATGREGDWCLIGLASQKNYISIYVCAAIDGQYIAERNKTKMPKASVGKSCIRFKKFEDIDFDVLKTVLEEALSASPKQ